MPRWGGAHRYADLAPDASPRKRVRHAGCCQRGESDDTNVRLLTMFDLNHRESREATMKLERLAVVAALALSATACAADRNKDLKHAETNLTSEQQRARSEAERLEQKQAQERAEAQAMSPEQRAELEARQLEEHAETKAEGMKGVAEAQKDVTSARAELEAERTKVEAEAKERLTKAEAKATEAKSKLAAKTKIDKLSAEKQAKYDAAMNTFDAKKSEVQSYISDLSRSSDAEWKDAKAKIDKSLDDLEAAADRLDDAL